VSIDACSCGEVGVGRRIVITGGPGAGKTAVLELLRKSLCPHVRIAPESATILFGGGFPRDPRPEALRAMQRAIFHVQLELEAFMDATGDGIVLCDRGIVDGAAYWPGPGTLWQAVGTDREAALQRYSAVVHLRVPDAQGFNHSNPVRTESAARALEIDRLILAAWEGHPQRTIIASTDTFIEKAERALKAVRAALPECCMSHATAALSTAGTERVLAR